MSVKSLFDPTGRPDSFAWTIFRASGEGPAEVSEPDASGESLAAAGLSIAAVALAAVVAGRGAIRGLRVGPILRDTIEAERLRKLIHSLIRATRRYPPGQQPAVYRRITGLVKRHSEMIGLPPLRADRAYPERPSWQRKLLRTLRQLEEQVELELPARHHGVRIKADYFYKPVTLPLRRVLPFHYLTRRDVSRTYLDKLNEMRGMILCQLMLSGWKPGTVPSGPLLHKILSSLGWTLEEMTVIGPTRNGYHLLRNGNHRISSLISLVHDGIFPESVLERRVFLRSSLVGLRELFQEAYQCGVDVKPVFWPQVLGFHRRLSKWVRTKIPAFSPSKFVTQSKSRITSRHRVPA